MLYDQDRWSFSNGPGQAKTTDQKAVPRHESRLRASGGTSNRFKTHPKRVPGTLCALIVTRACSTSLGDARVFSSALSGSFLPDSALHRAARLQHVACAIEHANCQGHGGHGAKNELVAQEQKHGLEHRAPP